MKRAFLLLLVSLALCAPTVHAQSCLQVDHGADDQAALNRFWGVDIPMCQQPGSGNAFADKTHGVVWVDQSWLDQMAMRFGNWAATGILAHEWGHMVQGPYAGTASELQADCLAGVFMRGVGLPWTTVEQFVTSNMFAGDPVWGWHGHGTSAQRVTAARRGFYGYRGQQRWQLPALCPLSAF